MKLNLNQLLCMVIGITLSSTIYAQANDTTELPAVVVTGNPLRSELFDLAVPISVLRGQKLQQRLQPTLGETLTTEPGINSSYFGPNASRPVIRGLDGERIRILQNGIANLDASGTSVDHAVSLDPLLIDRIEVVRGPAAIFYGTSAMGGVVNVIDNRISVEPNPAGVSGAIEGRYGSNNNERSGAGRLELGLKGGWSVHLDGFNRRTDDLKIPGLARSQPLRDTSPLMPGETEKEKTLTNSASNTDGAGVGTSYTWDQGYIGASYSQLNNDYGTVAEEDVTIRMRQKRTNIAGEWRDVTSVLKAIKFKWGHSNYQHTESEANNPATTFKNRGYDTLVEFVHNKLGSVEGAIGVQSTQFDLSALGNEAFLPTTNTNTNAIFIYEEMGLDKFKFQFGGRVDQQKVAAEDNPNFGAGESKKFHTYSSSFGAVYNLTSDYALALTTSFTQRAPNYQELFANGRHAATGIFERGDRNLGIEKSTALDLALRKKIGMLTGSVGVFYNRFSNFIALVPTGTDDGDPIEPFPIHAYQSIPATFKGLEAMGTIRLTNHWNLELKGDYLQAKNRNTNEPLPRISPLRYGSGLVYQTEKLGARVDLLRVQAQHRVAANELSTDGYTMVNASVSYRFKLGTTELDAFLRSVNLLNQEARNHVSFLKDVAPLGGRGVVIGIKASF